MEYDGMGCRMIYFTNFRWMGLSGNGYQYPIFWLCIWRNDDRPLGRRSVQFQFNPGKNKHTKNTNSQSIYLVIDHVIYHVIYT